MASPSLVSNTSLAGGVGANANSGSLLSDVTGVGQLGADIYGLIKSSSLNSSAQTVLQQSNPFGQYRPQYGAQLSSLMSNPGSVSSLPGYQFLMDQGIQAVNRGAAGPQGSGLGSGGNQQELMKYGQGLADQFYQQQVTTLSGLAGANINPANPYQALQGAGAAQSSLGSSIGGLLGGAASGISGLTGLLGKLFPNGTNSGTAGDISGLISGSLNPNAQYDNGFSGFAASSGYDPISGTYTGNSTPDFGQFALGSGYNPTTGDFSSGGLGSMNLSDLSGGSGVDLSDMFSGPSGAGGQAATGAVSGSGNGLNLGSVGSAASAAGGLYGIYSGATSDNPVGEAGAAVGAAKLGSKFGAFGDSSGAVGAGAGLAGAGLGIYSGIQQGGVVGDTQAGIGAVQLSGQAASAAGSAAGSAISAGAGALSLALAPAIIGYETPAVALSQKYWDNYTKTLQNDINTGNRGQFAADTMGFQSGDTTGIPANILQMIQSSGIDYFNPSAEDEEQIQLMLQNLTPTQKGSAGQSGRK